MTTLLADWTWLDGTLHRDLAVTIQGGVVTAVGPPAGPVQRLPGRVLLPGFVNAHSHAFQRVLRGRVEAAGGSFWGWRDAMYRAVDRLTPDLLEAATRFAFVEMVAAGWTHVVEFHYVHHQAGGTPYDDPAELSRRVLAAAEFAGIGITLLPVAYQRGGAGVPAAGGQLRFLHTADAFARLVEELRGEEREGVRVGFAAHSVRAVDRAFLAELVRLPAEVVHAHVSEQPREIRECLAEHGRRPIELLADVGLLGSRFTGVHATHLGDGEAELLGETGSAVCVCPTTERNLGDGLPDLGALLAAGVPLSLGTDSHARIDPFAEARALEDGERLRSGKRVVLAAGGTTAAAVLAAATTGGARCAGVPGGRLVVGAPADLVAVALDEASCAGTEDDPDALAGALLLTASPRDVTDVWVRGRRVVADRRHARMAEAAAGFRSAVATIYG